MDPDDFVLVDADLPEEELPQVETIWTLIASALMTGLSPQGLYLPGQS